MILEEKKNSLYQQSSVGIFFLFPFCRVIDEHVILRMFLNKFLKYF
jgi:hypothetical protein